MQQSFNLDYALLDGVDPEFTQYLSRELDNLHRRFEAAQNGADLEKIATHLRALEHQALNYTPAEALTRMISVFNDALTLRVIEMARRDMHIDSIDWCWIAFGSEGRQEQTFSSDQDNGIIFHDGGNADARREILLPLASRINLMLADCGFALCPGNIMASNPECCLSLHEWQTRFSEWMIEGDVLALLNATIFFDFRALYGDTRQADSLATWLAASVADNPRFLLQMSDNALRRDAPLGLLHRFVVEKHGEFAGTIDLKLQGATLFVDAARVFALACGSHASNTADRLRQAAMARLLEADEVETWIAAFYLIEKLRLKNQHASDARGEPMHNHIDPNRLDVGERHALLDALDQARALQKRLAQTSLAAGRHY